MQFCDLGAFMIDYWFGRNRVNVNEQISIQLIYDKCVEENDSPNSVLVFMDVNDFPRTHATEY